MNHYKTPSSELEQFSENVIIRVYSSNQVAAGSFLGGPIATVYFLKSNFDLLRRKQASLYTIISGSLFVVVLLGVLPFLSKHFPMYLVSIVYVVTGKQVAEMAQLRRSQIESNPSLDFVSNWKVILIALLSMIAFIVIEYALIIILNYFGLIRYA